MKHGHNVLAPEHREVSAELLNIDDKVFERLTTGDIPGSHASLDGKFRLEGNGVMHCMSQCF